MKKNIIKKIASVLSSFFVFSGLNQKKVEGFPLTSALIYSSFTIGSMAILRLIMGMIAKSIVFGENSQEEDKFLELAKEINSGKCDFLKVDNVSSYPELGSKLIIHTRHVQCSFGDEILDGAEYSFDPSFVDIAKLSNRTIDLNDLGKNEDSDAKDKSSYEKKNHTSFNEYLFNLDYCNNKDLDPSDEDLYQDVGGCFKKVLNKDSIDNKILDYELNAKAKSILRFVKTQKNNQQPLEVSDNLSPKVSKIREKLNLEGKYILYNGQMWNPSNLFLENSKYLQDVMISGGKIVVYEYPERYGQGTTSPLKWLIRNDRRLIDSKQAIYEYMAKNYGGENIIVCGYSMGGNISIRLTDKILKDNKKLAGLILISPAHATFDFLKTYGKSAGWSDKLIDSLMILARIGIAEVPGFPAFNEASDAIKNISKHKDFAIYLTTGNSKDYFYLGYTNLDKSFNGKNQVAYASEEKDSNGNEISVDHYNDNEMVWGDKFVNWLKQFDTRNKN